jgi:ParB family chromosome partitioning protein
MRKRALGRGIEALIGADRHDLDREGFRMLPLSVIKPNPHQPRSRIKEEDIRPLAASIREKGVIEPIIVRRSNGEYVLAAGERRFRAAMLAGLTEIPAVVRDMTDAELLEIGLVENLNRQDLGPLEEAAGYDELHRKFQLTHDQIARLVGKDRSTVTNALRLLGLPEKVKGYLRDGRLTEGHARALLSINHDLKLQQSAERIVRDGLSVRAAERMIKKLQQKPAIRPGRQKEANLMILEDELSKLLHTKIEIAWKKNHGKITIHCYSLEDFNRVYDILRKGKKA